MELNQVVNLVKEDKHEELKNLLCGTTIKQKCDLLTAAVGEVIQNFAQILEVLLENTGPSVSYQIMIHSLEIINSSSIEETHLLSILPVLYLYLNHMELSPLTALAEFLLSQISNASGKNTMWTELLPRIIQIIVRCGSHYFVTISSNLKYLGYNYRSILVGQLIDITWKRNVIPDVALMLKQGIPVTETERFRLFDKLCNSMEQVDVIGTFSYHLFQASLSPKLFVGVLLALDKYFRHYYWKKMKSSGESEPTQSSVMAAFPEGRFRQEEDVIISQMFYEMEYNFTEERLANSLKEITLTPELLLTPFIFESLIAMSRINQTSDTEKVSVSVLITKTLHTAIKNNHTQIEIIKSSYYIKTLLEDFPKCLDLENIIRQIIDDSQTGLEVIIPGLFGLAYSFFRKNKEEHEYLHHLASNFLIKFLHRRPLYTEGVFEKLMTLMIRNTKGDQYKECLTKIITSKIIILEPVMYENTLKEAFDDIPFFTSPSASNLMTIVLKLLRKSSGTKIRNLFVDMLRQAMSHSLLGIRQMAVYGCGLLLKQIKYREITDNVQATDLTAAYNTGYSLLNQMTQMRLDKLSPHDMMTLEIMGVLAKAFCLDYDIKHIMYSGLRKAAMSNHKVLPHVVDFLIPHLKTFVDTAGSDIVFKLDKVVEDNLEIVVIKDNFGTLMEVLVSCVIEADLKRVTIENVFLRDLITKALARAPHINFIDLGIVSPYTEHKCVRATQFLNFLECLMTYAIWKATDNNDFILKLLKVSHHYHHCFEELKKLANPKTGNKRKKESRLKNVQSLKSVWDLGTLLRFLSIYFNVDYKGLTTDQVQQIKSKSELKIKVLTATNEYVRKIRSEPSYMEIKFNIKHFQELCDCAKISFDRLFDSNEELACEETLIVLTIFKECVLTAKILFKRQFENFLSKIPKDADEDFKKNVFRVISQLTEMILKLCEKTEDKSFEEKSYETKLLATNVSVVEMLLPYMDAGSPFCAQIYQFFFDLCTEYSMNSKSLGVVLKVLFALRQKAKPLGDFYITVATLLSNEYGHVSKKHTLYSPPTFELKCLTKSILEITAEHFLISLRIHLDQNTFLLKKANALIYRLMKIPGQKKYSDQIISQIKEIEKMTINLLTVVCKTMTIMSDAEIPLGRVADNYFRVLILLYSNGEKLAKIFMNHNTAVEEEIDFFGLQDLCNATRKLTRPVGTFILYIQGLSTIAASNENMTGPKAAKKILRDARYIPKYVLWFEKFSVEIIRLSSKTNQTFKDFLHLGVYRDFRFKPEALQNAIDKQRVPIVLEYQNSSDAFEPIEDETDSESCDEISDEEHEENSKRVRFAN